MKHRPVPVEYVPGLQPFEYVPGLHQQEQPAQSAWERVCTRVAAYSEFSNSDMPRPKASDFTQVAQ